MPTCIIFVLGVVLVGYSLTMSTAHILVTGGFKQIV